MVARAETMLPHGRLLRVRAACGQVEPSWANLTAYAPACLLRAASRVFGSQLFKIVIKRFKLGDAIAILKRSQD